MSLISSLLGSVISPKGVINTASTKVGIDLVNKAMNGKFDVPYLFNIIALTPLSGSLLSSLDGWNIFKTHTQDTLYNLGTSIQSVVVSPVSYAAIEEWVDNHWYYTMGRPELKYVEITFRDYGANILYNSYKDLWWRMRTMFPDDQKWAIMLSSRNPYDTGEIMDYTSVKPKADQQGALFLSTTTAILESVSSTNLAKDGQSWSTFSVRYKYFHTDGTN